jgi:lipopolysaccharide transport system permease protein
MQLLLFVSPIIYPTSIIPEKYQVLASLNPLCGLINSFRSVILPSRQLDWQQLSISLVVTLLLLPIGFIYFRKTERNFADII